MPRRSLGRRIFRVLVFVALSIVVLLIALLVGARIYFSDQRLAEKVPKLLSDQLAGDFTLGSLHWKLPATIELRDLRVEDPEGIEVLRAGNLRASVALFPLIHKEVRIEDVYASDIDVKLFPPPAGHPERGPFTLADAFRPAEPAEEDKPDPNATPPTISVDARLIERLAITAEVESYKAATDHIDIRDAFFRFGPEAIDAQATLRIDEVRLQKKKPGPDERAEVGPIAIALESTHVTLRRGKRDVDVDVGGASIAGLGSKIGISGRVEHLPDDPRGEAEGTIELALDDEQARGLLPREWLAKLDPHGRAQIRFDASGSKKSGAGHVELEGTALQLAGNALESIEARARVADGTATIDRLTVRLPAGRAEAKGTIALASPFAHALQIYADDLPVRKLAARFTDPSVLPQSVTATASVEGKSLSPLDTRVVADARIENIPGKLTRGLFTSASVRANAAVKNDRATIAQLSAVSDGVTVRAKGEVPFSASRAMALNVAVKDERPTAHFEKLRIPLFARALAVTANLKGTYARPEGSGLLTASGAHVENTPPAEVRAPVALAGGVLSIESALIAIAGGHVALDARARILDDRGKPIDQPALEAKAELRRVKLAPFTHDRVEGAISGTARFQGTSESYLARAELGAGTLVVEGTTVAVSKVLIEGNEKELILRPVRVTPLEGGALLARGTLDTRDRTFKADVRAKELPLSLASAFSDSVPELGGTIELGAHGEGALARPVLTGTVSIARLSIDRLELERVTADVSTDLHKATAKIAVRSDAGNLDASGKLDLDTKMIDAHVRGIDLDVKKLPGVPARELGLAGKLGVDLYAQGKLPVPVLSGTIGVRDLTRDEQKLGNGRIEATLKSDAEERLHIALTALGALSGQATLARVEHPAEGRLPIEGDAQLLIDHLHVADLVPSLSANGVHMNVIGRADLAIGKSAVPVTGQLTLTTLNAKFGAETLGAPSPIILRYDGKDFILEPLTLSGSTGEFHARGRYGEKGVDLHTDGTIQLAFLEPFVPKIARAEGRTRLTADVSGPIAKPRITGEVQLLTPATIRPRGMVRELALDTARIILQPGIVKIDQLTGRVSGGKFEARGDLGIDGFKPVRWNIRFDGTNLPYRSEEILVEADASLRATGTGVVPRISGDVEIIRGRYLRKFRLEQFVFVQRGAAEEEDQPDQEPNPYLQELELDIHAKSAGAVKMKIDAQAFSTEMDLGADLFVRGTAALPRLDGRVLAESGWMKFPSAKLNVEQMVVDFKPTIEESIHPLIDLVATGEVTAAPSGGESRPTPYEVTVHIEGPLNAMKLDLQSDPSLPQDQVLSLVVLGQADPTVLARTSDTRGSGTIESSLVFAGSQLATPVTRFVEKQLEQQLNLELQLGTEVSSERFRLTAARDLTSRFRIEGGYERLFTESAQLMTGRVQLFLSNKLFVEGTAQNVTMFSASSGTSDLEAGTTGTLELKLRLLGE